MPLKQSATASIHSTHSEADAGHTNAGDSTATPFVRLVFVENGREGVQGAMKRLLLARALDRAEAGSYIVERFVYRSIDKMPDRLQPPAVKTVGKATKNTGHAARTVVERLWQRWG